MTDTQSPITEGTRLNLSAHFTLRELCRSTTAADKDIDNLTPATDPEILGNLERLAGLLEQIRSEFGPFSPGSGYRSEELEWEICATPPKGKTIEDTAFGRWCAKPHRNYDPNDEASWKAYYERKEHPRGRAADVQIAGVSGVALWQWCKANMSGHDRVLLERCNRGDPTSGVVHVVAPEAGVPPREQAIDLPGHFDDNGNFVPR